MDKHGDLDESLRLPLRPRTPRTHVLAIVALGMLALVSTCDRLIHSALRHAPRRPPSHLDDVHPATAAVDRGIDWSYLSHDRQCPGLERVGVDEFGARRDRLATVLLGPDRAGWGAYVTEPSANTLYYLNLTQSDWYLSERPWLAVLTPSSAAPRKSHVSILTPAFELSRSRRLPFAVDERDISWVTWQEHQDPYRILVDHLVDLRNQFDGRASSPGRTSSEPYSGRDAAFEEAESTTRSSSWSIEIEENVRQFVSSGIATAVEEDRARAVERTRFGDLGVVDVPRVGLAKLEVRELRMRKTDREVAIQKCVAKITLEALRAVRGHLRIGMTEKEGEALIVNALKAGGLTQIGAIVLFGANAALPHASAGSKRLERGEFALFDVDGALFGYMSDFTRTMLPGKGTTCPFPNERARKVYETVQLAQRAALAQLVTPLRTRTDSSSSSGPSPSLEGGQEERSVVYAAQVDRAAREVIERAGWGDYFTHRLGHGIGLEVHEPPFLNSGNSKQVIRPGETFSNEPGIYIEDDGLAELDDEDDEDGSGRGRSGGGIGVRLEDMVIKTDEGWGLVSGSDLARSPCDF
ncbi:hypothetical protein JCM10212_005572 [Sporobolomyces blumeae]